MMACSILTLILGGTTMLHRMNHRPSFILLVLLACGAIASSTGREQRAQWYFADLGKGTFKGELLGVFIP
jgi:hypothetical protein